MNTHQTNKNEIGTPELPSAHPMQVFRFSCSILGQRHTVFYPIYIMSGGIYPPHVIVRNAIEQIAPTAVIESEEPDVITIGEYHLNSISKLLKDIDDMEAMLLEKFGHLDAEAIQ